MDALNIIPESAILVGSAPDARVISDANIPKSTRLIAINNAWRLRTDFAVHICPNDFPSENKPPLNYRLNRVQNAGYTPALRRAGGTLFCGATMAFCAGYYALSNLPQRTMGFVGCNMVYEGAETHFYGNGQPDPIKIDPATYASIKNLRAKSSRLFLFGLLLDVVLLNLFPQPKSQLILPSLKAVDDFPERRKQIMADPAVQSQIVTATQILMRERQFPSDRYALNLQPISNDPDLMKFIDGINSDWESLGAETCELVQNHLST